MVDFNFGLSGTFIDFDFTDSNITLEAPIGDFEFGYGVTVYTIFRGVDNNFKSIWCDPKASLTSNRFYVGRVRDLSIINTKNRQVTLEDYYSNTVIGETEYTLRYSYDIVDISVSY